MRLCRFRAGNVSRFGLYLDDKIVDLSNLWRAYLRQKGKGHAFKMDRPHQSILDFLPPSQGYGIAKTLEAHYMKNRNGKIGGKPITLNAEGVELLAPIPNPSKFFFLAGNYAEHVEESGERAEEKKNTFPHLFMKPPSTTITDPWKPIRRPIISPDHIDWEVELAVVIGKKVKGLKATEALSAIAGYTIVIDVSDRGFRPNPNRKERPNDGFFDWLHGKWHDGFAPMGPCITSSESIMNPQNLRLSLKVNGETMQDSNTSRMIFTVVELIEFISSFVTLEPGDVISTGTPAGIGETRGRFLKHGDMIEAEIEGIGLLRNPVE